ncbi:MAG: type II secretion system protein [Thiobacillus sp.]|nr:type II secretion system protein [Thiobacillus sp.]
MRSGERGFVLVALLFLVVGLGVAMSALGTVWHTAAQREKEKDLLFAGEEYRRAIAGFWRASPAGQERLPKEIGELLLDPRFPYKIRHLRKAYRDPMTGSEEWGLVRDEAGGIAGVYSLSESKPFRQAGFAKDQADFEKAANYRDWVFLFKPEPAAGKPAQAVVPKTP